MFATIKLIFVETIALFITSAAIVQTGAVGSETGAEGFLIHGVEDMPKIFLSLIVAIISRFAFKWIDQYFTNLHTKKDAKKSTNK